MARWALARRADAIIFIDCGASERPRKMRIASVTHLGDFLNVADGLESELKLTEGGHVSGIGPRRSQRRLGRHTGKRLTSKHGGEVGAGGRTVGRSRLRTGKFPRSHSYPWGTRQFLHYTFTVMASEEPLFDPSLKKRKKKAVAFTEDPLGADADPTTPAPETIDNTTTNGEAVDLGPTTAHEQMKLNGEDKKEDDEFKAMFGDLKKKKKKKEIPLDLVCLPLSVILISLMNSLGRRFWYIDTDDGTSCCCR